MCGIVTSMPMEIAAALVGGNKVDDNVKGLTSGMVGDAILGFALDIVGGASKAGKGGELLQDSVKGVADMVVEGWFTFFWTSHR
jgi:hypothetical protein